MNRVEKYRECAAKGMSVGDTARLCGVTLHAVRAADTKHSLGFNRRGNAKGRDLVACRERLTNLAAEGKRPREMALAMRVPKSTIIRWCREWNIARGQWKGGRRPVMPMLEPYLTPKEADDVRFLRSRDYTFKAALKAIGRADLVEGLR